MKFLNPPEFQLLKLEPEAEGLKLEVRALEDYSEFDDSDDDVEPLVSGQGDIVTIPEEEEDKGQEMGPFEDLPREDPYSEDSSDESAEEGNMGPEDWRDWSHLIIPDDPETLADRIWMQLDWQLRQPLIPEDSQGFLREICDKRSSTYCRPRTDS